MSVRPISDATKQRIEFLALDFVVGMYEAYRTRGGREPSLTTVVIRDYIIQASMPEDFRYLVLSNQTAHVRNALNRLKSKGLLTTSIGIGESGKEARMWEPK